MFLVWIKRIKSIWRGKYRDCVRHWRAKFSKRFSALPTDRRYLPEVRNEWPGRRDVVEFSKKRRNVKHVGHSKEYRAHIQLRFRNLKFTFVDSKCRSTSLYDEGVKLIFGRKTSGNWRPTPHASKI